MPTPHEVTPTVERLMNEKGQSITAADLEALIARFELASRRRGLMALSLLCVLVGGVIVGSMGAPGQLWHLIAIVVTVGAFAGLAGLLAVAMLEDGERRKAEQVLAHLREQPEATNWALALAASGEPFALFLRSFAAEDRGANVEEADAHNDALFQQSHAYSQMAGWHVGVPVEQLEHRDNSWTLECRVLHAVSRSLPTVMLGNALLTPEKRSDLARLNVRDVTVVAGDWWSVFLALSGAAREIIIFADEPTGMLRREIEHLDGTERRYTLVLRRALEPALGPEMVEGERCGRISIIRYGDYGDSIDDALKQRWPS